MQSHSVSTGYPVQNRPAKCGGFSLKPGLEYKKIKRTGLLPAFIGCGLLSAVVPVAEMAVRSERYQSLPDSPVAILLHADWQMMSMLNVLLLVVAACILYHTEYADNALLKMCSLPLRESSLFFGKILLLVPLLVFTLALEAAALGFCCLHWFALSPELLAELACNMVFSLLLLLPAALLSLLLACACKNMWISLGIGVVCIFTATMLPSDNFLLSLFPYAMPFQILAGMPGDITKRYAIAAALESLGLCAAEVLFLKIRRWLA